MITIFLLKKINPYIKHIIDFINLKLYEKLNRLGQIILIFFLKNFFFIFISCDNKYLIFID